MVLEKSRLITYHYTSTVIIIKTLIFRQIKIMVLKKSRPTFHYRFAVMRKNVIFRQIKIMFLEKSRPTYYYIDLLL